MRRLSKREQEIESLVIQGLANKEIAALLHLSERTVKFHVSSLLQKREVYNRHELSEGMRSGEANIFWSRLSLRQKFCAYQASKGKTFDEIAPLIKVHPSTVKRELDITRGIIGLRTLRELAVWMAQHDLLSKAEAQGCQDEFPSNVAEMKRKAG